MNFIQIADVHLGAAPEAEGVMTDSGKRRSGIVFTKSLTSVRRNRLTYC